MPSHNPAGFFDVNEPIDMRGELAEQPQPAPEFVGSETPRTIHGRPHELGPNLPIALIERRVRNPRRCENLTPGDRASKHPQPVTASTLSATHEARRKRVLNESRVMNRGVQRLDIAGRCRRLEFQRR
jgi:hypothetical protein